MSVGPFSTIEASKATINETDTAAEYIFPNEAASEYFSDNKATPSESVTCNHYNDIYLFILF